MKPFVPSFVFVMRGKRHLSIVGEMVNVRLLFVFSISWLLGFFFILCHSPLVAVSLVLLTSHTHCRTIVPLYN